jgi:hypothetical protein
MEQYLDNRVSRSCGGFCRHMLFRLLQRLFWKRGSAPIMFASIRFGSRVPLLAHLPSRRAARGSRTQR